MTAAIEAGVREWLDSVTEFATPRQRLEAAVAAAAPLIEAAVREQIAQDIHCEADRLARQRDANEEQTGFALRLAKSEYFRAAARIARGES